MRNVQYIHLSPETVPPMLSLTVPFVAVVIIEADVSSAWRAEVSRWLVDCGCLFMMAWGRDCVLWNDSVDDANIDDFPDEEIPEERMVLTTWHDDELREEVLWFAQVVTDCADRAFEEVVLIDICKQERCDMMLREFSEAEDLAERKPE